MRIDKFLKVSRIIKRRTIANEAADNGRISVNGKVVKPSYDIKINDIVEIKFGDQTSKFKITAIPTKQSVRTDEVAEMVD
jgi:S4 RNA-binding domain protein